MLRLFVHIPVGIAVWWFEPRMPWLWVFGYFAFWDAINFTVINDSWSLMAKRFRDLDKYLGLTVDD